MKNKLTFKQILQAAGWATLVSVVLNSLLFFIFHATGVLRDDIFIKPGQSLSLAPVIFASILPVLVAALVFYLIERFTSRGFLIFSIVGVLIFLLTIASPFTSIPDVTTGFAVVLDLMHVVVFGSVMYFFRRAYRRISFTATAA